MSKVKWEWKSLSHVRLCDPMDYTVHGILQARILEWVAFSFSRVSSQPRDRTQVSDITGRFFTSWATREAQFEQNHTEILGLRFMPTASSTNCADVFFFGPICANFKIKKEYRENKSLIIGKNLYLPKCIHHK